MDSRTMRLAVLLSIGALTLILLVVYAMNRNTRRTGGPQAAYGETGEGELQPGIAASLDTGAYLRTIGEGFRAYGEQIGDQPKAFMYDENFFDPMHDVVTGINDGSQEKLSLEAAASGDGIHVSVTNSRGGLEEGVAFQVVLEQAQGGKQTTWTDTDRDGKIEIPGLQSGSYRIRLIAVPGYEMPDAPVVIKLEVPVQQEIPAGQSGTGRTENVPSLQEQPAGTGASQQPEQGMGQEVWDHAE